MQEWWGESLDEGDWPVPRKRKTGLENAIANHLEKGRGGLLTPPLGQRTGEGWLIF